MHWIELAAERPPIVDMNQTNHVLVAYYPAPDTELHITIAFYDQKASGSGWMAADFAQLPAPRYWMPLPELSAKR